MARPRILPDADVLGRLRRAGCTYRDIAYMYGVSVSAVHVALTRSGLIEKPRPRYEDNLPWRVKVEHSNTYLPQMLRLDARQRAGSRLTAADSRYLDNWRRRLREEAVVVAYDEKHGFRLVPARVGIDNGLIRVPDDDVQVGLRSQP